MSTILVVDDMPLCREPLEVALQAQGYRTLRAADGRQALDSVRSERPDLILLDVQMPVMDGLRCLRALRADPQHRGLPVIMLTDAADREVVTEAAKVGIQGYLLKSHFSLAEMLAKIRAQIGPAKPEDGAGERPSPSATVCGSASAAPPQGITAPPRSKNKTEVLERLHRKLRLKAVPPVLHRVIALTNSSKSSLEEIANAISQDQSLALKLMRVANSSFYGSGSPVQNAQEAAQRIGLAEVQNMIVAILAMEQFESSSPAGLIPQRFWEHGLAAANLTQLIAKATETENGDQLFLAALLHDVGRVLLADVFPDEYRWVLGAGAKRHADLVVAECEVFGLSHVDVTKEILAEWKLPNNVVEAAIHHELGVDEIKQSASDVRGCQIVALANRLAHALAIGDSGDPLLLPIRDHVQALELTGETVRSIVEEAVAKIKKEQLIYSSRGDQQFLEPLAKELASAANGEVRLTVVAKDAPHDPLSLFCEQLGWLDAVQPRLAALCVSSDRDISRRFDSLQKLEETLGTTLGVLMVSPGATVKPSPHLLQDRPCVALHMPARYADLVAAVAELQSSLTPLAAGEARR